MVATRYIFLVLLIEFNRSVYEEVGHNPAFRWSLKLSFKLRI